MIYLALFPAHSSKSVLFPYRNSATKRERADSKIERLTAQFSSELDNFRAQRRLKRATTHGNPGGNRYQANPEGSDEGGVNIITLDSGITPFAPSVILDTEELPPAQEPAKIWKFLRQSGTSIILPAQPRSVDLEQKSFL